MKTKIAYTLVTDENDFYLEQLLVSLVSLKHHSPSAYVVLVTDSESKATMVGNRAKVLEYIDDLIVPETPKGFSNVLRSRYLKTTLRQHITGDFLYVDTDTVIASPLDEIDEIMSRRGGQLAGVDDCNAPLKKMHERFDNITRMLGYGAILDVSIDPAYFNGGVMFAADTPEVHTFYSTWNKNWNDFRKKTNCHIDQLSLAFTNREFPSLMKFLGNEWNCQIAGPGNSLLYLYKAKIIHYGASGFENRNHPYLFSRKDIFEQIKSKGSISQDIMEFILEPRSAFLPCTQLVTEEDYEYNINSPFHTMLERYPKSFAVFSFIAKAWMFFPNRIKRFFEKKKC